VDVDWSQWAGDEHPIKFLLRNEMSIYYKIQTSRCFAVTMRRFKYSEAVKNVKPTLNVVPPADWYMGIGREDDICILQMDEPELLVLCATGSCMVTVFWLGGLKFREASKKTEKSTDEPSTEGVPELMPFERVEFEWCFLADRWLVWPGKAGSRQRPSPHVDLEECVYEPRIECRDLYVEEANVAELRRRGARSWVLSVCPIETADRKLPIAIFWLYQASIAFNRDSVMERDHIANWLRETAPDDLFKKRWVRTADSIIPLDGLMSRRVKKTFDADALGNYWPVSLEHVGDALLVVIALALWWCDQHKLGKSSKVVLASELEHAGFKNVAIIDLVGMISGEILDGEQEAKLIDKLGR